MRKWAGSVLVIIGVMCFAIIFITQSSMSQADEEQQGTVDQLSAAPTTDLAAKKSVPFIHTASAVKTGSQTYSVRHQNVAVSETNSALKAIQMARAAGGGTVYTKGNRIVWSDEVDLSGSAFIEAPKLLQLPELFNGCEITSLAMLLQVAGIDVDKETLAKAVKKDPTPYEETENGVTWGNPAVGFVGDIIGDARGYGVYHQPVYQLAKSYLPDRVIDVTGATFSDLKVFLSQGEPVWVIVNMTYQALADSDYTSWVTPDGHNIQASMLEHSVLIVGYDAEYVYFNDPLGEQEKAPLDDFVEAWEQMGNQAIVALKA